MTGNIECVMLRTNLFFELLVPCFVVICYWYWYYPQQATRRELDYDGKIKKLEKEYTEVCLFTLKL